MGDCLSDNAKKPNDKYKLPGMLPGAMYDAQYQCDQMFPGSTVCARGGVMLTPANYQADVNMCVEMND